MKNPSNGNMHAAVSTKQSRYSHNAVFFSHWQSTEVRMCTSSIPVPCHWFRIQGDHNAKVFSHSVKQEPCHPDVVTCFNTLARSNLELPLCWHDLCIGACNLHSSIKACSVVGLNDSSSVDFVSTNTTIVGTWGQIALQMFVIIVK